MACINPGSLLYFTKIWNLNSLLILASAAGDGPSKALFLLNAVIKFYEHAAMLP